MKPTDLFLLNSPVHVRTRSPNPDRPANVAGSAPIAIPSLDISARPLVIKAALAFIPSFRPSDMPAAIAMTFFSAPPSSTPTMSLFV